MTPMRCYQDETAKIHCIESMDASATVLSNIVIKTKDGEVDVPKPKLYSYTMLACFTLLLQLLILMCACYYVRKLKKRNKKTLEDERAQYYRLFY